MTVPSSNQSNGVENDELELARRAGRGDEAACTELFERYRDMIFRIAYARTSDPEDALDICQETFIRAFRSLKDFRGASSVKTWLAKIATNISIDYLRKRMRSKTQALSEEMDPPAPGSVAQTVEAAELQAALWEAIQKLPDNERAVLVLHAIEHRKYREIAETLSCPIGTVMSRLHTARQRLLRYLGPFMGGAK